MKKSSVVSLLLMLSFLLFLAFSSVNCSASSAFTYNQKIVFAAPVLVSSSSFTEVSIYTRTVRIPRNLDSLQITLNIPFVGNDAAASRSRIRLVFDDIEVSDGSKYNSDPYELNQISLSGLVTSVSAGTHTVKVFAAVDQGTLNIPHYNPSLIEATLRPVLFANLYMIGFPAGFQSANLFSYTETIPHTTSITVSSTRFVEIPFYTRTLNLPMAYSAVEISLHIPFVGNDAAGSRSRIILTFDNAYVSDGSKFNSDSYELQPITLSGLVKRVSAGAHTIRVYAAVDMGNLNIPLYNPGLIEATLQPAIYSNLFVLGFP